MELTCDADVLTCGARTPTSVEYDRQQQALQAEADRARGIEIPESHLGGVGGNKVLTVADSRQNKKKRALAQMQGRIKDKMNNVKTEMHKRYQSMQVR